MDDKPAGRKRKPTRTSGFGAGKRESHDSSAFYASRMAQSQPGADKLQSIVEADTPGDISWADQVYCQSCEAMTQVPDASIALTVTSPPYNASKDYDADLSLEEYLGLIGRAAVEVYRVLKPGGRYAVNVANLGRKPYIPLHAYFYEVHRAAGFLPLGEIIWRKAKGASGSTAWGSWMSAKAPCIRDVHEYILVFAKGSFSRPDRGKSDINREDFLDGTLSVWDIPPESARRIGHPAPFPTALAERLIRLFSYKGEVVLDPFMGSGSTAVAAVQCGRHFVGYETEPTYVELCRRRVEAAVEQLNNSPER